MILLALTSHPLDFGASFSYAYNNISKALMLSLLLWPVHLGDDAPESLPLQPLQRQYDVVQVHRRVHQRPRRDALLVGQELMGKRCCGVKHLYVS